MRTWFLNDDSDPILDSSGNIKIIEGLESLAENLNQRLKLFKYKYFMSLTSGVPYLEEILVKPVDPGLAVSILNAEIMKEPEVTGIGEVTADLDPDTREFFYSANVQNIFGTDLEVTL